MDKRTRISQFLSFSVFKSQQKKSQNPLKHFKVYLNFQFSTAIMNLPKKRIFWRVYFHIQQAFHRENWNFQVFSVFPVLFFWSEWRSWGTLKLKNLFCLRVNWNCNLCRVLSVDFFQHTIQENSENFCGVSQKMISVMSLQTIVNLTWVRKIAKNNYFKLKFIF